MKNQEERVNGVLVWGITLEMPLELFTFACSMGRGTLDSYTSAHTSKLTDTSLGAYGFFDK